MVPEEIQASAEPVELLRAKGEDYTANFPVVPNEITNWIDEQRAITESAALANLSHHMASLRVSGPDARDLLRDLSVNSFEEFPIGKAKQIVMCNPNGHIIGDGPMLRVDDDEYYGPGVLSANWVKYNQETGDYDADVDIEARTSALDGDPDKFVYQVAGPNAPEVLADLTDADLGSIGFYNFEEITFGGADGVLALGHGMSTEAGGFEFVGDFEDSERVREAIVEAGEAYDLRQLGSKAYHTLSVKLGWLPPGVPPIYDVEEMADYREWLDADSREATYSIDGSYDSDDISDYYMSPVELGYESLISFDHDFVGRDALESQLAEDHRELVTLEWNDEDVVDVFASLFGDGGHYKYMDLPRVGWGRANYDTVTADGEFIGTSHSRSYQYDIRSMISLCRIDPEYSETGTEVTLTWGEASDSPNPKVEEHEQTTIRATVREAPYSTDQRK
ncbi:vanillate/3-O-methylgallate O-demethylase [Halarchaeum rubridurum]|uniref:Glycine cleavage system protein T n=1 Tax=Halarchaeum rubridurum TaxID=489911 RepID=A0A830FUG1_9EURY|nr:aminomethyl transferase family protein [Halarchaeum rubridurum]MBP1954687.1 vanillate/3-O-methylgallate O-demethylase [Halarchaeum rubridurum]GGM63055.1 glycine cleavage system protein T [Halarchaeum rubridurum]